MSKTASQHDERTLATGALVRESGWTRLRHAATGRLFVPLICAVLLAQALVVTWMLSRSYFIAEDYTFLQLFRHDPLSADLLGRSIFGHLIPGYIALNKYFGAWLGPDWRAAGLITLAVQAAQTVGFTRLVIALRGRNWWVPLLTVAFGLSVVMLNTAPWWAATTTIQIALGCCVSTWGCAIRYARTRRARHLVSLFVMFLLGTAFWEKSIITCAYLGLFVLFVGLEETSSPIRAKLRRAVSLWPVWLIMATISAADLLVYSRGDYLESAGATPGIGQTVAYLVRSLTEGLFPTVFGMIYPQSILPGPDALSWVLPTLLIVVLAVWTSLRSPLARQAWVWFVVADVVSQLLVARGRLTLMGTTHVAHEPRYELDATYLLLITIAVAVPTAIAATPTARRPVTTIALVMPILVIPLWGQTIHTISADSPGGAARAYLSGMRQGKLPPDAKILNVPFPGWIIPEMMYPWNMSNRILPFIHPGTKVTNDPSNALFIRLDGTFAKVQLHPYPGAQTESHDVCVRPTDGKVDFLNITAPLAAQPSQPLMLDFHVSATKPAKILLVGDQQDGATYTRGNNRPYTVHPSQREFAALLDAVPERHVGIVVSSGGQVCVSGARLVTPTS